MGLTHLAKGVGLVTSKMQMGAARLARATRDMARIEGQIRVATHAIAVVVVQPE